MTVETPESPVSSIARRAKAILTAPREEWPIITGETAPSGDIFTRYAMPLAAIGPVAGLVGGLLVGYGPFAFHRAGTFSAIASAVAGFILSLVMLLVMTFVANWLAPRFGGEESPRRAFKLVAYAMTAAWLAGIVQLVPALAPLGLLGLYSIYLFHVGAGPLMKIPADRAMNYTAVNIICGIVLALVAGSLAAGVGGMFHAPSERGGITISTGDGDDEGFTIDMPDGHKVDEQAAKQAVRDLAAAASDAVNGKGSGPAAPRALQALLPETIGAYRRTEISNSRAGPGSEAKASYEGDGRRFTLKLSDIALVGALTSFGAALGVESERANGTTQERTTTQDGNFIVERWNSASHEGRYLIVIDKRFLIEAEGRAASLDELKAAVGAIDKAKLTALAKS